jgi:hypothetical protein
MESMPLMVVATGRLMAQESASKGVNAPFEMVSPEPPMLFIQDRHTAPTGDGQDIVFKAAETRIQRIERHLDNIKSIATVEHLQIDRSVLVSVESHEADLPLLLCPSKGFENTIQDVAMRMLDASPNRLQTDLGPCVQTALMTMTLSRLPLRAMPSFSSLRPL